MQSELTLALIWIQSIKRTNICKHVKYANDSKSRGRSHLESFDRIPRFGQRIIGVAVANITPDDVVEGRDNSVTT